jgi:hypothetical protein
MQKKSSALANYYLALDMNCYNPWPDGTPTKRQVSKRQVSKRLVSSFNTSGFKTSGLQYIRFTKSQVSKRLVSKRPVFKFDILILQVLSRPWSGEVLSLVGVSRPS